MTTVSDDTGALREALASHEIVIRVLGSGQFQVVTTNRDRNLQSEISKRLGWGKVTLPLSGLNATCFDVQADNRREILESLEGVFPDLTEASGTSDS